VVNSCSCINQCCFPGENFASYWQRNWEIFGFSFSSVNSTNFSIFVKFRQNFDIKKTVISTWCQFQIQLLHQNINIGFFLFCGKTWTCVFALHNNYVIMQNHAWHHIDAHEVWWGSIMSCTFPWFKKRGQSWFLNQGYFRNFCCTPSDNCPWHHIHADEVGWGSIMSCTFH
jgi:hypothetical protein